MSNIGILIVVLGSIITLSIPQRFGLSNFTGTRYRTRLLYCLWLAIFFSAAGYLTLQPSSFALRIGTGVGIVLTIPTILWEHHWFRRHLSEDLVIRYPSHQLRRNQVRGFFIFVVTLVLCNIAGIEKLREYSYIYVAFLVSWFLSTIFELVHVTRLEKRSGKLIVEQSRT